jgi:predicted ATPase
LSLWSLGYPDRAFQKGREAITLAREISHAYSVVFALIFEAMVHQRRRDALRTLQQTEAALALANEHGFAPWLAWGTTLRGWALVDQGRVEEGIAQLRQGIAGWKAAVGSGALAPYFLTLLGEAYMRSEQSDEGLETLAEALAITDRTHEGYAEAEIHRLKGELLLMRAAPEEQAAEASFRQAIDIARRQGARSLELRGVMSLSRLYQKQGKRAAARPMLAEIYGWFSEGFDTAALKEAAALLEHFDVEPRV